LWGGKGQFQTAVSRAAIDRHIGEQQQVGAPATGGKMKVVVKFHNVPKGVKTEAKGDGALKDITTHKTSQTNAAVAGSSKGSTSASMEE
jgi:hypothetical protein